MLTNIIINTNLKENHCEAENRFSSSFTNFIPIKLKMEMIKRHVFY